MGRSSKIDNVLLLQGNGGWDWLNRTIREEAERAVKGEADDRLRAGVTSAASAPGRRRAVERGALTVAREPGVRLTP